MRQDRWFVRSQGISLGPLTAKEIKQRLFLGELQVKDKGTCSHIWKPLADFPEFEEFIAGISAKSSDKILLPPSPTTLRQKKPVPLPVLAVVAEAKKVEKIEPAPAQEVKIAPIKIEPVEVKPIEIKPVEIKLKKAELAKPEIETPLPAIKFPERPAIVMAAKEELKPQDNAEEILDLFFTAHKKEKKNNPLPAEEPRKSEKIFFETSPAPPIFKQAIVAQEPIFLREIPVENPPRKNLETKKSPIKIEINLSLSKQILFISGVLFLMCFAGAIFWLAQNKTRDLKSITSSDPPSPTTLPREVSDPISPLKAPTRPKRD